MCYEGCVGQGEGGSSCVLGHEKNAPRFSDEDTCMRIRRRGLRQHYKWTCARVLHEVLVSFAVETGDPKLPTPILWEQSSLLPDKKVKCEWQDGAWDAAAIVAVWGSKSAKYSGGVGGCIQIRDEERTRGSVWKKLPIQDLERRNEDSMELLEYFTETIEMLVQLAIPKNRDCIVQDFVELKELLLGVHLDDVSIEGYRLRARQPLNQRSSILP